MERITWPKLFFARFFGCSLDYRGLDPISNHEAVPFVFPMLWGSSTSVSRLCKAPHEALRLSFPALRRGETPKQGRQLKTQLALSLKTCSGISGLFSQEAALLVQTSLSLMAVVFTKSKTNLKVLNLKQRVFKHCSLPKPSFFKVVLRALGGLWIFQKKTDICHELWSCNCAKDFSDLIALTVPPPD